jgi:hypothetical protein
VSNASGALICPPSLWPALSTLIGQPWPPVSESGIAAFVRGVEDHRLLAIAAAAIAGGDDSLPVSLRARIDERDAEVAETRASAERDIDDLLTRLPGLLSGQLSGQWLAVNGADFRRRLYPSARLRPMSDIDLLVRTEDAAAIARQLVAHGFTPRPGLPGSTDIGLDPPARDARPWSVWLDLYPGLVDRSRADIDYEEIWSSQERGPDGLPRMAHRHALAAHALLIANMQLVTHLRKFLDLWLLSRDAEAVRGAVECSRRWNIRRSLYVSFAAMRRVFPETTADSGGPLGDHRDPLGDPLGDLLGDLLDPRERAPLDRLVERGAPFSAFPSRPVQIWRKLSLLDSPAIRARFAVALARRAARRVSGASAARPTVA